MPNEKVERRALAPFELREGDSTIRVVGHAAVFNQEANIAGAFREVIRPGAFTRAIGESDVPFLIEHDDLPLARNTSGTLKLSQDEIGLRIETELDTTDPDVQRIVPKMRRGDLSKMSFAFRVKSEEWEDLDSDMPLRVLRDLDLFDVSIVTTPAYSGTDIALRSLDDARGEIEAAANAAAEAEREKNRKAAELRVKRLGRILDLKQRKSALDAAIRSAGA